MRPKLVYGDNGADVTELQKALLKAGFSPGVIDADFGSGTRSAVTAYQQSQGMLADGVAGPRTLKKLGLATSANLPDATGDMTVQIASQMLPGAPLSNIKTHLPIILASLRVNEISDRTMVLVAIATIRAETAGCIPIGEGISSYNTSSTGHPFDLYDFRTDLGNTGPPDGALFKGRGFVQLTGRSNYKRYGLRLSPPVDLVKTPELANAATLAADLLCLFLSDRELQIKDALMHGNFQAARRLVNGGLHGWKQFEESLKSGDTLLPQ